MLIQNKYIITAIIIIFNSAHGCVSNDNPNGSEYLDQDYYFVAGILTPDSSRTYKTEVFFGKILDKVTDIGQNKIRIPSLLGRFIRRGAGIKEL